MAATIEDDASLNDFGDDEASGDTIVVPDFMPDARHIMRRFPRSADVDAAPTEVRAFRETFGTSLLVVQKVWCLLVQEGVLPHKGLPKHLLWALHFLKVYPLQGPGCATVGESRGAIDPKTHRKWVWEFIEAIAQVIDEVVSNFFCYFTFLLYINVMRRCDGTCHRRN